MTRYFWVLLCYLLRLVLSLRYRIEIRGLDSLSPTRLKRDRGILFLPNHPALLDTYWQPLR